MGYGQAGWFHQRHDVVVIGYRGVDGSVVLSCPEASNHFKNAPGDLLSPETLDAMADAYSRCAQRLVDEGVDLDGYTAAEVVDDVEAVRTGLGYDKINLISESYGTRLAMYYSWEYPERVHRSAMIGVNPPGRTVYDPKIIDEQIEYFSKLCANDPECSSRTDDLAGDIKTGLENMPERWLGIKLHAGTAKWITFESLPHTRDVAKTFDVWIAAAKGDYSGLAMVNLVGPSMFANSVEWGENTAKVASLGDYDSSISYATIMDPPDSYIGSPRSVAADGIASWPGNPVNELYRSVQPSDVETLVINGSIDIWTPARHASNELMPYLSNGQEVILSEFGHINDLYYIQPQAMRRLLSSFFDTGYGDASLFEPHAINFDPGLGFPAIMKLAVGTVVATVASAVAVTVWLIMR